MNKIITNIIIRINIKHTQKLHTNHNKYALKKRKNHTNIFHNIHSINKIVAYKIIRNHTKRKQITKINSLKTQKYTNNKYKNAKIKINYEYAYVGRDRTSTPT